MTGESERRRRTCATLLEVRRQVGAHLGFELCPEPAWDILLELYAASLDGRVTYLWPLAVASNIAISSAHRRIAAMVDDGLLIRKTGVGDRRRIGIELSENCLATLNTLMDRLSSKCQI